MEKLLHLEIIFPLFIFLLALQFFSRLPFSSAYTLPDEYFINCGSKSNFSGGGGQNFVGDLNSGISFFVGQSSPVTDASPPAGISLLYQSARIYRRPSFYEFVINKNGTYFVRLHFFVSSSSDNLANAIFSVSVPGFWLLSNFSVKKSTGLPVIKEFLVTVNVGRFKINFIPSEGSHPAFVNAIEVFLTPESFIPDTALPLITPAVGSRNSFDGLPSQVLHTIYRINVGGLTLTPENDTLWRNWIPDDRFLFNPKAARNSEFFTDTPKYQLGGATEYIAPSLVYKTAKELNIDDSRQSNFFNITWRFNVSKSSRHFVRVHFCDTISVSLDVTIFNLYIYSKFGQRISPYDKMGQLAAPFYFDFVVDSDESGIMNISIGPRHDSQNPTAFLNGLEIMELMKKSDFVWPPEKPKSKRSNLFAIVGSVVAGAFVIILIMLVLLSLKCRKAKPEQPSSWPLSLPLYRRGSYYNRMSDKTSNMSPSDLNLALRISYYEIEQSTKNFDSNLLIGEGGFGKVYEGLFHGKKVAVKRSEPGHGQGLLEFQTEIVVLSQIRHRHLVSLIGYCDERSEMILVYEFMERGTLRDNLYCSTANLEKSYSARSQLSWKQRLEICIGAAKGLNYLHTGSAGGIIHRDVKSTNILLDEQFVAKVADFGLSKSGLPDVEHSVDVKGTFGYLDPEYFISLQLTNKSDVYSFGVVLLEVLCARPAVVNSNRREEVLLAEWGMLWLRKGELEKIIDPMLVDTINPNSFRKFAETTEKCLKPSGSERPIMRDVLWDLQYALQLQLTPMNSGELEDSTSNASLEFSMPVLNDLMEISLLKALLRNISSFLNLSSFENINSEPVQKYYQRAEEILKLLKPIILNAIDDSEITSDEVLSMAFEIEGLVLSIEELREQFESWQPLLSKIYFVLQVESLISKIRNSSLDILQFLKSSIQHLPDELSSASLEHCLQKIKHVGYEQTSSVIREAITDQVDSAGPSSEILVKIAESLSLISNQEILIEGVALEKLKENAEQAEKTAEVGFIDQFIALVTHMHHRLVLIKQSQTCSPVLIPADFCCPLSLELMTDPVIVASGQTYERAFIKKWFDLGLIVCPKTRQTLAHTYFIPNYTLKALIKYWCESNNVKLPDSSNSMSLNQPYPLLVHAESDPQPAASAAIPHREPEFPPRLMDVRSQSQTIWRRPSDRFISRIVSSPGIENRAELSGIETQVKKLVEDLKSTSVDTQREATAQLRLLSKQNMCNRIIIANCGAISLLVDLLRSPDTKTQENAVTALLNSSVNDNNRTAIANANAIEPLIHVLETGSPEAKENSAATLFSLSVIEDNKFKIGRSGAIRPLVDLLGNGTPRGKKDAATALFNLSILHENKSRIVQAGAVRHLLELMDTATGMVDKAVAVLASLAKIPEGSNSVVQEDGIPLLVEVVETGSARGKKNAVAALFRLCTTSSRFCSIVLQEGAVPPLVALSQSGTPKAREMAQALLSYFRNQRHGNAGRG